MKYTNKDIKKIKWNEFHNCNDDMYKDIVMCYELNGIYLLKQFNWGDSYYWQLRTDEKHTIDRTAQPYTYNRLINEGKLIEISSFREGKDLLLKLANERG
jgi:hypothetical protein